MTNEIILRELGYSLSCAVSRCFFFRSVKDFIIDGLENNKILERDREQEDCVNINLLFSYKNIFVSREDLKKLLEEEAVRTRSLGTVEYEREQNSSFASFFEFFSRRKVKQ